MTQEITRNDILMLLPLTVLSLADPTTDILTLIEYYNAGHKNWFAVSLIFMILPCFSFAAVYCGTSKEGAKRCMFDTVCLCGFHPFTAALQRLEAFIVCGRKKLWRGETISEDFHEYKVMEAAKETAFFEAIYESAPQFVIQLYVASVQEEPVSIVQMISLPVSLLSLVWSFKSADEDDITNITVKYKILIFVTNFFLLSARLSAITYFVVVYKWFFIGIIIVHFIVIRIMHCCWPYRTWIDGDSDDSCCETAFKWYFVFGISWLGYETFETENNETESAMKHLKIVTAISYVLLVLENFAMILLYYIPFGPPNTWYSLPVTVCVCSFSVLGVIVRFILAHKLEFNDRDVHPQ